MLLCVYIALSLVSFDPNDPSFTYSGDQPVSNFGGPVGAWLSDLLFQIFGHGAWSILLIGGFLGLKLAGRPTGDSRRHIGWAAVFWVGLCFVSLLWPFEPTQPFAAGGLIGETSVGIMHSVVGPAGTWLIVCGFAIAVSPVLLDIQLESIAHRGLSNIERAGPHLQDAGSAVVSRATGAFTGISSSLGAAMHALTDRLRRPALVDYDDEMDFDDFEDADELSEPDSIPPSVASGAAPSAPTERPSSAFFDEPDELFAPESLDRTQVGQRELVEVEWETTRAPPPPPPRGGAPPPR
ncbi:MAG: S-DNA-T family DNA segregation ATPase FtsK/SpoIIIE, partial [Myxococcota bacterium]